MTDPWSGEILLEFEHTCRNPSFRFIIVGDARDFISDHETPQEAEKVLRKIHVGESQWGQINILAPGESVTAKRVRRSYPEGYNRNPDWEL